MSEVAPQQPINGEGIEMSRLSVTPFYHHHSSLLSSITGCPHPVPRPVHNRSSQGQASFSDSSWPLFNIYNVMKEGEDEKVMDRSKKDADSILIFVSP
jgi:hypothetical protein